MIILSGRAGNARQHPALPENQWSCWSEYYCLCTSSEMP